MPTYSIPVGPPTKLDQNVAYAMPAIAVYVAVTGTAPQVSNDGITFAALPATGPVASAFIKSAGADTVVTLKRI